MSAADWRWAQDHLPILCVDVLPIATIDGQRHIGLIEREHPEGTMVWCHLGGRVWRGETIAEAIRRHLNETLSGAEVHVPDEPQPQLVMQWFPERRDGLTHSGVDPRKHAVALCFVLPVAPAACVSDGGEGLKFRWFAAGDEKRVPLWRGTDSMIDALAL
ncbi:DUF4916 domain-containing protein [Aeromicrobium piscarium]|uniref:DUF4916 domain-containing protein n=1 Tax=Aeromicrobium piscarium TaxID=2590901 RepID=UPI00163DB2F2|nr:DUF4916 domain-containing protein [Aeromicrobium piscarium]